MNVVRAAALLAILALAACESAPTEPEDAETAAEEAPEAACCTIDDVIAMHRAAVDEEIILTSVQTSSNDLNPSAQDLIRLSEAGVSKRVVKAMMGEDPGAAEEAAADDAAAPAAAAAAAGAPAKPAAPKKPAGPPPLGVMVAYIPGSKTLTLTNSSGKTYTGLVLTANDEYVYALPIPLPPGNPDKIRIGSFTSPKTGHKLYPAEGLRTLSIKADQGRWSKRF